MHNKNKYDIVIIGSGLGGLISGAILAKNGKKVCVLEKQHKIGGNLQTFNRKGCSFGVGMHYGGSLDKGQVIYKIFNYLGIYKNLEISKLDSNSFERIFIGDKEYSYAMGMDNFKNTLLTYFPNERVAIEAYTKRLNAIWESSDLLNLREININNNQLLEEYKENAYEYINSLSNNEELKAVLAATNGLYIGNKTKTPLLVHANINTCFINSAWRIAEKGNNLAKLLEQIIVDTGGCVLVKKKVEKLNFNQKAIVSASVKDGETYYADTFISNIHPVPSFKLIEKGKLRRAYINRLSGLENSISIFMLFVVLKKQKIKNINSNIYYSKTSKVWDNYDYTNQSWPQGYMMYTTEDSNNKGYAESLVIMSMMKFDDVRKWSDTTVMKRGDDYLDFKKEKENKLLELVNIKFPNIKSEIDSVYSASPLTFRDYTGTYEGSMYGIVKDCNNPMGTYLSPKTRIPNLLLTGQNIGTHGLLGVIMTSFQTCSQIIEINKVLKEIKQY